MSGHSDLLLGAVAVRDGDLAAGLRRWRSQSGAVPGPFEAWLAHRSLATLGLRLERQSATALALARRLRERGDVAGLRHPGLEDDPSHAVARRQMALWGPLVSFALPTAGHAQAFLDACALVAEATSFGGVHSTAERRARWGTDAVAEGFIRFSAGCEDTADLVADVDQALDAVLLTTEGPHGGGPSTGEVTVVGQTPAASESGTGVGVVAMRRREGRGSDGPHTG